MATMNPVVWTPKKLKATRMWQFMRFVEKAHAQPLTNYQQLHDFSVQHPSLFWQSLCDFFGLQWDTQATEVLNQYTHMMDARWFSGVTFNFAEQLLSRDDEHPAIISIDENGERQVLSYQALKHQVSLCAAGLKHAGLVSGDRVAGVMPNVAYTIIAMLATTALGAIWSSCSPEFGVHAIVDRLEQIEPKVLFVCDGHQYQGKVHPAHDKIAEIITKIPSLQHIVVCPFISKNINLDGLSKTSSWDSFLKPATTLDFASLPFSHPLYILFSSGTTGKPKCIIHSAGGTLLQHIKELGLHVDMHQTDNLLFYTTCGWMMWNWMVSTLALGATLTLYEGSPTYPDASRLFELLEQEQVSVFGTSAKFISTVEKEGLIPKHRFQLKTLRCILSTGSPLMPQNYDFVYQHIKADVQLCSMSGGTDIVSCFALGNPMLPVYRGELQCLGLGMSVEVFDESAQPVQNSRGELVCTKPFPSMPIGFWDDPHRARYKKAYFERFSGVWAHGDFAEITSHGGLIIYGRSDAILNPGGVRIGTAEIYRQVEKIPEVIESVAIGQDWQDDVRVILFVKLQEGMLLTDELQAAIRLTIRTNASPRHVPAKILQVADIPRTINGKVVELAIREMVHARAINNIDSIANPEALVYFKDREELR